MAAVEVLTKLERTNQDFKGKALDFHPLLPYVLYGDAKGQVSIYDYTTKSLFKKFQIHDDICRCVKFHPTLPVFASGGDDFVVKVFDFENESLLCTFKDHCEFIRNIEFHKKYPWILSASDDLTARIWNFQNGEKLCLISGHTEYVMCAKFHPSEEHLVFTCSLDQSIKVWDITNLIKKTVFFDRSTFDKNNGIELFADSKYEFKFSLFHERGINWFSVTDNYIYAVDDENLVKIWRYNSTSAWIVDSLSYHKKSITCVANMSQHHEFFITCSEDGEIVLWDSERKVRIKAIQMNCGNLWQICCHPSKNLLALAHDKGFTVFKLYRERPSFYCSPINEANDSNIYFLKHKSMMKYSTSTGDIKTLCKLKLKTREVIGLSRLSFNPSKNIAILSPHPNSKIDLVYLLNTSDKKSNQSKKDSTHDQNIILLTKTLNFLFGGSFDIDVDVGKKSENKNNATRHKSCSSYVSVKHYTGLTCGFWVSKREYVAYSQSRATLSLISSSEEKKITLTNVTNIFHIYDYVIGCYSSPDKKFYTIDIKTEKKSDSICIKTPIKMISVNNDQTLLAILEKSSITIADMSIKKLTKSKFSNSIKDCLWVMYKRYEFLIFNNSRTLKYLLKNGESGLLGSLNETLYLTTAKPILSDSISSPSIVVFFLSRNLEIFKKTYDIAEVGFKLSLLNKEMNSVAQFISSGKLCGQSIVSYVMNSGYPDVALHFSNSNSDPYITFQLAKKSLNIEKCLETAVKIGSESCWKDLFDISMSVGNISAAEKAAQNVISLMPSLALIYLVSGQKEKLLNLYKKAKFKRNYQLQLHISLFLNDSKLLTESLQDGGMTQIAKYFGERTNNSVNEPISPNFIEPKQSSSSNWPTLDVGNSSLFLKILELNSSKNTSDKDFHKKTTEYNQENSDANNQWESNSDNEHQNGIEQKAGSDKDEEQLNEGWNEVSEDEIHFQNEVTYEWKDIDDRINDSHHAANHSKLSLLELILSGESNYVLNLTLKLFTGLDPDMLNNLYTEIQNYSFNSFQLGNLTIDGFLPIDSNILANYLVRNLEDEVSKFFIAKDLEFCLKAAQKLLVLIKTILISDLNTKDEKEKYGKILNETTQYALISIIGLEQQKPSLDTKRKVELSAYMANCSIKFKHQKFTIMRARDYFMKVGNFETALYFAESLKAFDLPKKEMDANDLKIKKCKEEEIDKVKLNYNYRNKFTTDPLKLIPIFEGQKPGFQCKFCKTNYFDKPNHCCSVCSYIYSAKN